LEDCVDDVYLRELELFIKKYERVYEYINRYEEDIVSLVFHGGEK
jgi:hypothetical protein